MTRMPFSRWLVVTFVLAVPFMGQLSGVVSQRSLYADAGKAERGRITGPSWRISSGVAPVTGPPAAAIDHRGRVHVIWTEQSISRGERATIQYSYYNGVRWSKPQKIASPLAHQHEPQDCAVVTDAGNRVHVVWSEWYQRGGHYLRFDGREWSVDQPVSPEFLGNVALAADSKGSLFMTFVGAVEDRLSWHGLISPHESKREILEIPHYATLRDGRWSVLGKLDGAAAPQFGVSAIAVGADEKVHVLYERGTASQPSGIEYAVVYPRATAEVKLTTREAYRPSIAVDKGGVAHCAWGDVDVSYCQIERGLVKNRVDNLVPYGRAPAIVADASGRVHLACLLIDEGRIGYMIRSNDRWTAMVKMGNNADMAPALVADQHGNGYAFWVQDNKLYGHLMKAGDTVRRSR